VGRAAYRPLATGVTRLLHRHERRRRARPAPEEPLRAVVEQDRACSVLANRPDALPAVLQFQPPACEARGPRQLVQVRVATNRLAVLQGSADHGFVQDEGAALPGVHIGRGRAVLGDLERHHVQPIGGRRTTRYMRVRKRAPGEQQRGGHQQEPISSHHEAVAASVGVLYDTCGCRYTSSAATLSRRRSSPTSQRSAAFCSSVTGTYRYSSAPRTVPKSGLRLYSPTGSMPMLSRLDGKRSGNALPCSIVLRWRSVAACKRLSSAGWQMCRSRHRERCAPSRPCRSGTCILLDVSGRDPADPWTVYRGLGSRKARRPRPSPPPPDRGHPP